MRAILCACLVLVAACVLAKQYDTKSSADENRILALENAWNSAEQQKDAKELEELLANSLA